MSLTAEQLDELEKALQPWSDTTEVHLYSPASPQRDLHVGSVAVLRELLALGRASLREYSQTIDVGVDDPAIVAIENNPGWHFISSKTIDGVVFHTYGWG